MNLFELFATISLNTDSYKRGLEDAQSGTKTFGDKLKSGLATAAKVAGAALGAAATAVATLTKQAVAASAEYEQLAGGVEKIFSGMDTSKIFEDASNAYINLGMSVNKYLSAINDVGATFKATMGDEKGYNVAKQGMQAIADYASGTGKSVDELTGKFMAITRSTASYQSIADQFSGILPATSADFLKQAQAAGYLKSSYKSLTDVPIAEYQAAVSSMLAKGVDALNLTGNTAAEALGTLSGSAGAAKAAWENMVTAMASGDTQMFNTALSNLVTSTTAFAKNLVPVIGQTLTGVGQLVEGIAPVISEQLPALLDQALPPLVEGALSLVTSAVSALPVIAESVVGVIPLIAQGLLSALPTLATSAVSIISTLASGIGSALPTLLPLAAQAIVTLALGLTSNIGEIIQAGLNLISGLAQGLLSALPILIQSLPQITESIVSELLQSIPQIIETGVQLISALVQNLPVAIQMICDVLPQIVFSIIETLIANTPQIVLAGVDLLVALIKNLPSAITTICSAVPQIIAALVAALVAKFPEIQAKGREMLIKLKDGISEKIEDIRAKAAEVMESAKAAFQAKIAGFAQVGKAIVDGIKNGIAAGWSALTGWVREKAQSLLDAAKSALGIASPSKKTAYFGKMMAEGFGVGFADQMPAEIRNIQKALDFPLTVPSANFGVQSNIDGISGRGGNAVTIVQHIYSQAKTAAELARETRWEAERAVLTGV